MIVDLDYLIGLAKEAGYIIIDGYNSPTSEVRNKGDIDLLTETDIRSEKYITEKIRKDFPLDDIMTEEEDFGSTLSNRTWIIDPLDGTTNFTHRFPFVAVSIGLEIDKEIRFAVVFNPLLDELFYAEKGKGAYLNGKAVFTSTIDSLSNSLIATGFPYDRWQKGDFYIKEYLAFMKRCQGVRRAGAAALDLCYCACGRLDGFFERKLQPWDTAAGSLILLEAGGMLTDFEDKTWNCREKTILASNGIIHDQMLDVLKQAHRN